MVTSRRSRRARAGARAAYILLPLPLPLPLHPYRLPLPLPLPLPLTRHARRAYPARHAAVPAHATRRRWHRALRHRPSRSRRRRLKAVVKAIEHRRPSNVELHATIVGTSAPLSESDHAWRVCHVHRRVGHFLRRRLGLRLRRRLNRVDRGSVHLRRPLSTFSPVSRRHGVRSMRS